ncbi:MAG: CHAT domain-containing protein [Planctomycetes bacterium]|nr:CHAT domain-containing protein [Planctomycetota bacterium]
MLRSAPLRRALAFALHACLASAALHAQDVDHADETPLDRILALLRAPELARERMPALLQRFGASPSFLLGTEVLAACEAAGERARVLELLPRVLALPHDFGGEDGMLVLDAAAMARAFGASAHLESAREHEGRFAWSEALRAVARGEACLSGLAVPSGEELLPLVEMNFLRVRSALLQLEVALLFGCGGHRLALGALREREEVLRRQMQLVAADDEARRTPLCEKLAECAALRAEIERLEGRRDRAHEVLEEARGILLAIEAPSGETIALVAEIEGAVAEDRGAVGVAAEHYSLQLRALENLGRSAPAGEKADALRGLGDLARRRGETAEALGYYERASSAVSGEPDALRFRHETQLAYRRSLCFARDGRGAEAQAELARCLDLLEALHRAAPQLGSGGVFGLAETRLVAEEWLRQNLAHGEPDANGRALSALERVRARGLLGTLEAPTPREDGARGDARVTALRTAALLGADAGAGAVRDDLAIALARLERGRAAAAGTGSAGRARWFEETQQMLRAEDGRALVYFLGQDGLWIWWLDGQSARHRRIAIGRAAFEEELRALQRALAAPPAQGQGGERLARALEELRATLLPEPFERELRGALTIVPDGALHQLPWGLLLADRARSLCVVPSLHARLGIREREAELASELEASSATSLLVASAAPVPGMRAPLALTEVERLAVGYGARARMLRGAEASAAKVRAALAEERCSLAHFAVHGVVDPLFPSSSGLALEDGFLWPEDVLALPRVPPLVVLNACSSGGGERSSAEGVIGVARAFLQRGASAVVATLWDVDDAAALVFAEHFHERLRAGDAPGFALLEAQRAVRARYPDPSAWGAFTLLGDGTRSRAIADDATHRASRTWIALLAVALFLAGLALARRALRPAR